VKTLSIRLLKKVKDFVGYDKGERLKMSRKVFFSAKYFANERSE
jgi:hypothetical protein